MVTRIPAAELTDYLERLYQAVGMAPADSRTMAEAHVEADLRGIPGHGSRLAPNYLAKLRSGRLNPRSRMTVLAESAGCLTLDGDLAPGPLAAARAVRGAVERARRAGVGLVTVRGSGHAGALGVHVTRAARQGLIGVLAAQTSSASVALHGGTGQPVLGNSALSIAVPGPEPEQPVLLDMATAAMSWGAVHQHARTGRLLPEGCALDRDGNQVRDPTEAAALLPGGARGQGLAILLELLVGTLTGSSPLPAGQEGRGLLCLAIDPAHLGIAPQLVAGVQEVGHTVRAPGGARMPGDRAWAQRADAVAHGISLDEADLRALVEAGRPAVPAPAGWAIHPTTSART
ncbi:Ldh family oxidoreductase [Streptomyces sp. NPDC048604]|uniref:Ldh family oxidoreductase n=1 Tax=Streptomyces sp. NPDC048604 TaxID=3365578 RepID=UPI00371538C8